MNTRKKERLVFFRGGGEGWGTKRYGTYIYRGKNTGIYRYQNCRLATLIKISALTLVRDTYTLASDEKEKKFNLSAFFPLNIYKDYVEPVNYVCVCVCIYIMLYIIHARAHIALGHINYSPNSEPN